VARLRAGAAARMGEAPAAQAAGSAPPLAAPSGTNAAVEAIQRLDLAQLMEERLIRHAKTIERHTITDAAEKRFGMIPGDAVDLYVRGQLESIPARSNFVAKVLGGGTFKIPLPDEAAVAKAREQNMTIGPGDVPGTKVAHFKWEGLASWFKPFMTVGMFVPFPSFVMRNVMSSAIQGTLDPDIGFAGAAGFFRAVTDGPIAQALMPHAPNDVGKVLRAIRAPDDAVAQAALKDVRIGTYSAEEVVRMARGVLTGHSFADSEVFEVLRRWPELGKRAGREELEKIAKTFEGTELLSRLPPKRLELLRAAVKYPAMLSQYAEDSFRVASFMALVRKGVDPGEAVKRVQSAFVDYNVNSGTERMIRDLIPFARYSIGSAPVTLKAVAQRPRTVLPLSYLMRDSVRGDEEAEGIDAFSPEAGRGRFALPIGTDAEGRPRYAQGFGTPFENAADVLGLVPRPTQAWADSARRMIGAGITPPVRAPMEFAAGVNFFTGRAPRSDTRPVEALKSVGVERVPGWVNSWLLGAMPWSRASGELNRLLDSKREGWDRFLQAATGVRVVSTDMDKAARRAVEEYLQVAAANGEVGKVEQFFAFGEADKVPPDLAQALAAWKGYRAESQAAKREQKQLELKRTGVVP
jgi:hypothetical protein